MNDLGHTPAAPVRQPPSNGQSAGAHREAIENSLLAAMPRKEYRRLAAALEPVSLTFGEVL
ncbi:MAG TPA: hypothetical protein VJT81_12785, partial [Burkholderiales bacterium]|nr:hypothetical protein [Burkholderiales bacterium]